MIRYLSIIFIQWLAVFAALEAQPALIAEYTMDDCTLDDEFNNYSGFIFGPSPCGCGVRSNGLEFDGNLHFGDFGSSITSVFKNDFTLSFYVQFLNEVDDAVDLFSVGTQCSRDSVFYIKYFPSVRQLRVRMSDSPGNEVELRALLGTDRCWHYIAITKSGSRMALYVDGSLADEGAAVSPLLFSVNDNFTISNSPCLAANNEQRFRGLLDEIRLYDASLSERAISQVDYRPDRIISRDTTVFVGEAVRIETGGTCTDNFFWSPTEGLSNENTLNPIARPDRSTTYTLTVEQGNCRVEDRIRINVVTSTELNCEDLSLPSAFTPNGDGVNDRYGISNDFLIESLISFEVFNKWGGRVFHSGMNGEEWDGMYKDQPAPTNAYVYRVKYFCQGEEYLKSGTVNLLR